MDYALARCLLAMMLVAAAGCTALKSGDDVAELGLDDASVDGGRVDAGPDGGTDDLGVSDLGVTDLGPPPLVVERRPPRAVRAQLVRLAVERRVRVGGLGCVEPARAAADDEPDAVLL